MTEPTWLPLPLTTDIIPVKPSALWTLVCEYVKGPAKVKIRVESGEWEFAPSKKCTADGVRASGLLADALMPSAALGALIGKIGGSPADKPDAKNLAFAVGTYTIVILDDKTEGPLFLAMNDQIAHFDEHSGELKVKIDQARS